MIEQKIDRPPRFASVSIALAVVLGVPGCDEPAKSETAKSETAKAETAKAETAKAETAKAEQPPPDVGRFRKGQHPPVGMTPEEVKQYANAQGDPMGGSFTLEQALAGDATLADPQAGTLTATITTSMGAFDCTLYEDKAPITVANFVGLARGVRPSYDPKTDAWITTKLFDGVIFHRVKKGFMVQTGDPTGSGTGGPGYVIVDELDTGLKHSSAGTLSMANLGPNSGGSQFFVTAVPTKHLDGKHAVFGRCKPKVAVAISKVKTDPRRDDRPYDPVKIESITISRKS